MVQDIVDSMVSNKTMDYYCFDDVLANKNNQLFIVTTEDKYDDDDNNYNNGKNIHWWWIDNSKLGTLIKNPNVLVGVSKPKQKSKVYKIVENILEESEELDTWGVGDCCLIFVIFLVLWFIMLMFFKLVGSIGG
jgi:hypothetical protein